MKKIVYTCAILLFFASCKTTKQSLKESEKIPTQTSTTEQDDEWEVVVFDAEFETFINSRARPRSMFTEETLHSRNQLLVNEWNSRFYSGGSNRDIYEVSIEFNANTKYGFEFEYRLYQFFAFVNWKFGEKFMGLSQSDIIRN